VRRHQLEVGFVILLLAANAGAGFLALVTLAATQHGAAFCALLAFHFTAGCALFGRFLDLTGREPPGLSPRAASRSTFRP
jgi:hypothetical protein